MPEYLTVRVRNDSDVPWNDMSEGTAYTIPAGEEKLIPFAAAVLWFGHPESVDRDIIRDRTEEFKRLRIRYGAYDDMDVWEAVKPQMVVTDLDGKVINFVLHDPDGKSLSTPETRLSDEEMLRMIEAQQAQLDAYRRQLLTQGASSGGSTRPEQVAVDETPQRAAAGRR